MESLLSRWGISKLPASDARWELVKRIVSSQLFHRAPQLRDILVYVAARSLTESPAIITEQQIGSIVLGRGPDFDPGHENIVRAQMRHLRMKLEDYFAGEGRDDLLCGSCGCGAEHTVAAIVIGPCVFMFRRAVQAVDDEEILRRLEKQSFVLNAGPG